MLFIDEQISILTRCSSRRLQKKNHLSCSSRSDLIHEYGPCTVGVLLPKRDIENNSAYFTGDKSISKECLENNALGLVSCNKSCSTIITMVSDRKRSDSCYLWGIINHPKKLLWILLCNIELSYSNIIENTQGGQVQCF